MSEDEKKTQVVIDYDGDEWHKRKEDGLWVPTLSPENRVGRSLDWIDAAFGPIRIELR